MLEIVGVLLCVGNLAQPEPGKCQTFDDTRGPYETEAACLVRLEEIKATWPPIFADAMGVPGVSLFHTTDTCSLPGEAT